MNNKLVSIVVGQPATFPIPSQEGPTLDLWPGGMVLLLQLPGLTRGEKEAFKIGFTRYHYGQIDEKYILAYWALEYPGPLNAMDLFYHAKLSDKSCVDAFLKNSEGIANGLQIILLDGRIVQGIKMVGLDKNAVKSFQETIKKQISEPFNMQDYYACVVKVQTREDIKSLIKKSNQYWKR